MSEQGSVGGSPTVGGRDLADEVSLRGDQSVAGYGHKVLGQQAVVEAQSLQIFSSNEAQVFRGPVEGAKPRGALSLSKFVV